MHLKEVDANLLVILDALLVDASVTRAAKIVGSEARWSLTAEGGKLELHVSDEDEADLPRLRRTFVARGEAVYEIPWDEIAPARARSAEVTVAEGSLLALTFGDAATLDGTGVVHRGRVHVCGFARRL